MAGPKKKSKTTKNFLLLMGYFLGFMAWFCGFYCVEKVEDGTFLISKKKMTWHLIKVFLWTFGFVSVYKLFLVGKIWAFQSPLPDIAMIVLLLLVTFLYIWVFLPGVLTLFIPGLHSFFCPQCFKKQTFRFLPAAFQYGFFVTYLCRYCSCLVNGRGEQVFYPENLSFSKNPSLFLGSLVPALLTLFSGLFGSLKFFGFF